MTLDREELVVNIEQLHQAYEAGEMGDRMGNDIQQFIYLSRCEASMLQGLLPGEEININLN